MWDDNKFFSSKQKKLTKKIAVCIYTGCACYSLKIVFPVKYPFTLQRTFIHRLSGSKQKNCAALLTVTANIYAHLEYSSKQSSADAMPNGLGFF